LSQCRRGGGGSSQIGAGSSEWDGQAPGQAQGHRHRHRGSLGGNGCPSSTLTSSSLLGGHTLQPSARPGTGPARSPHLLSPSRNLLGKTTICWCSNGCCLSHLEPETRDARRQKHDVADAAVRRATTAKARKTRKRCSRDAVQRAVGVWSGLFTDDTIAHDARHPCMSTSHAAVHSRLVPAMARMPCAPRGGSCMLGGNACYFFFFLAVGLTSIEFVTSWRVAAAGPKGCRVCRRRFSDEIGSSGECRRSDLVAVDGPMVLAPSGLRQVGGIPP